MCIFDDCVLIFVWIIMIFGGVYFYWLFEYISFCILYIYDNFLEVGRIYSIVIFEEKIWKVFFLVLFILKLLKLNVEKYVLGYWNIINYCL